MNHPIGQVLPLFMFASAIAFAAPTPVDISMNQQNNSADPNTHIRLSNPQFEVSTETRSGNVYPCTGASPGPDVLCSFTFDGEYAPQISGFTTTGTRQWDPATSTVRIRMRTVTPGTGTWTCSGGVPCQSYRVQGTMQQMLTGAVRILDTSGACIWCVDFAGQLEGSATLTNAMTPFIGSSFTLQGGLNETSPQASQFVSLRPCRVLDTLYREKILSPPGESFNLSGACGIHPLATAVLLNVTLRPQGPVSYIGLPSPTFTTVPTSLMNSLDGRIKANAAIVQLSDTKSIYVSTADATHMTVDVNGYFIPPGTPGVDTLAFYPLAPCRVMDTRNAIGPLGGPVLENELVRTVPVTSSPCGVPSAARAYSLNATVIPRPEVGFLTLWATRGGRPLVSMLDAVEGRVVANAAIVPAGVDGSIDVFAAGVTDLVLDINGYFAPAGQPGALSYYPISTCRVGDTRNATVNLNGGTLTGGTVRSIPDAGSCVPEGGAKAYVFNATLVPSQATGYLSLWPSDLAQPTTSTLNALDGALTSNMAIVSASATGGVSIFSTQSSNLVLDLSGYFK